MSADWHVAKSSQQCAVTGTPLEVGDEHYSALTETPEGFSRADYSLAAWPEVDKTTFFSFWKTRVRSPEEKKRLVIDIEAFYAFFSSLGETDDPQRQVFRYLVALLLTRKRVLRLDEIEKSPDGDTLVVFDRRQDKVLRLPCPDLNSDRIQDAQNAINEIFECQIEADLD